MRIILGVGLVVVWLIGMVVILDAGELRQRDDSNAEGWIRSFGAIAWMMLCSYGMALIVMVSP